MQRTSRGRLLQVLLNSASSIPLNRQVYANIRTSILIGRIAPGMALPSTRALASDLRVARTTVVRAYEQLSAEGYIESRVGAGTVVCDTLPDLHTRAKQRTPTKLAVRNQARAISRRAVSLAGAADMPTWEEPRAARPFRGAVPAVDVFPIETWTRIMTRCLRRTTPKQLSYGDPYGLPALREVVAEYLTIARGVHCTQHQVMIVGGSQQALDLCARVLVNPGDSVWLEDPGYFGARGALQAADARVIPIPVDMEGIDVEYARAHAPNARAAFVTPSRQFPLGVTMSLARRLALLDWANAAQSWIVEDDYDSEFRYTSRPLCALQGLDRHGAVIYTGTFSKVLFPSLRLGYVVIPDELHDVFANMRRFTDVHSPHTEQAAVAEFMREGHFEHHVRRMRNLYLERQQLLLSLADEHFGERLQLQPGEGGLSVVGWLRPDDDDRAIAAAAARHGVDVMAMSIFSIEHRVSPGLLLGYAGLSPTEIASGVSGLRDALREHDRTRRPA